MIVSHPRDSLRDLPQDPATVGRIFQLNQDINSEIRICQENKWKATLLEANYRTSPAKLWRFIRSLQRKANDCTESHEAIRKLEVDRIPTRREQADILMKHYASISQLPPTRLNREIGKRLHRIELVDLPDQFSPADTVDAIKGIKATGSQGPDGISPYHLRHLGPHGIRYLTGIFNWSVHSNTIPNLWKKAKIIPIPKAGKPLTELEMHRYPKRGRYRYSIFFSADTDTFIFILIIYIWIFLNYINFLFINIFTIYLLYSGITSIK